MSIFSRRELMQLVSGATGTMALQGLSGRTLEAADSSPSGKPHHAARAKRVIFLFMHGGPSQVDTFDYKPELQARDGQNLPFNAAPNIDAKPVLMKSPWKFNRYGQSGRWVSELLPYTARHVDDLCVIHSVHSRGQSHGQAVSMLHTGSDNLVRPSVGAWVSYGLGSENPNLPAFVSIAPASGHGGPRNYGSAFLPAEHQATVVGRQGKLTEARIDNLQPLGDAAEQRRQLDLIQALNRDHLARAGRDPLIAGTIESYELAARMQLAAPEVLDLGKETPSTQALFGIDQKETENFGRQCLLARRMIEAGVRYVELSTGNVWDQHGGLHEGHTKNAQATDRPIAGLLADLKQRGLLEETLVVWGGEFGRTPIAQGNNGRDHNPQGFTMWMAGGGVRPGISYGATDDFGYYAVQDRVHMHDLHATMLHLMGMDHKQLTYRYAGRDFRLTDIYGEIVHGLLA